MLNALNTYVVRANTFPKSGVGKLVPFSPALSKKGLALGSCFYEFFLLAPALAPSKKDRLQGAVLRVFKRLRLALNRFNGSSPVYFFLSAPALYNFLSAPAPGPS